VLQRSGLGSCVKEFGARSSMLSAEVAKNSVQGPRLVSIGPGVEVSHMGRIKPQTKMALQGNALEQELQKTDCCDWLRAKQG
jgi:hypothetical protein